MLFIILTICAKYEPEIIISFPKKSYVIEKITFFRLICEPMADCLSTAVGHFYSRRVVLSDTNSG